MKLTRLFDGSSEIKDCYVGFEGEEIKYVGNGGRPEIDENATNSNEIIAEDDIYTVTPGFIDAHSHIGLVRSGEPDKEEEANERFNSIYPMGV
jgi:imidazolonepropionase-like amidohydrolase